MTDEEWWSKMAREDGTNRAAALDALSAEILWSIKTPPRITRTEYAKPGTILMLNGSLFVDGLTRIAAHPDTILRPELLEHLGIPNE